MAEVICRDTEHFTDLVSERMHRIDGIVTTESFFVLEVHKLAYGWGVGQVGSLALDALSEAPAGEPLRTGAILFLQTTEPRVRPRAPAAHRGTAQCSGARTTSDFTTVTGSSPMARSR